MNPIIEVSNLSKQYRLGKVGTGSLHHDLNRWWHRIRGREDPYLRVGEVNNRSEKAGSDYVWALRDIGFSVRPGEVLGIIGRNGAGKSTLLKILSRITAPTTGSITLRGRVASLLEVGTGMHPELTGRENIYLNGAILGMRKKEIDRKLDAIVDFAGVERYLDTPVKRYSSGMHVRLGFAVAAHLEPDILIVDEVLAVGDAEFQKKCIGKMQDVSSQEGRTVLFVSHQLQSIVNLCSRVLVLKEGSGYFDGDVREGISHYKHIYKIDSVRYFESGPITKVEIKQNEDTLILSASYKVTDALDIPNLGFVLYNSQGHPVFGTNALFQKQLPYVKKPTCEGMVTAEITGPKLLDDDYTVSVFFGDSKGDRFKMDECLQISVNGMASFKQLSPFRIGNSEPVVKWNFV